MPSLYVTVPLEMRPDKPSGYESDSLKVTPVLKGVGSSHDKDPLKGDPPRPPAPKTAYFVPGQIVKWPSGKGELCVVREAGVPDADGIQPVTVVQVALLPAEIQNYVKQTLEDAGFLESISPCMREDGLFLLEAKVGPPLRIDPELVRIYDGIQTNNATCVGVYRLPPEQVRGPHYTYKEPEQTEGPPAITPEPPKPPSGPGTPGAKPKKGQPGGDQPPPGEKQKDDKKKEDEEKNKSRQGSEGGEGEKKDPGVFDEVVRQAIEGLSKNESFIVEADGSSVSWDQSKAAVNRANASLGAGLTPAELNQAAQKVQAHFAGQQGKKSGKPDGPPAAGRKPNDVKDKNAQQKAESEKDNPFKKWKAGKKKEQGKKDQCEEGRKNLEQDDLGKKKRHQITPEEQEEMKRAIEEAARDLEKGGVPKEEIAKRIAAIIPKTHKDLGEMFPNLERLARAKSAWSVLLKKILRKALGIRRKWDPGRQSRSKEGQTGGYKNIKRFKKVIILFDTSSSLSMPKYEYILRQMRVFFQDYRRLFRGTHFYAASFANMDNSRNGGDYDEVTWRGVDLAKFRLMQGLKDAPRARSSEGWGGGTHLAKAMLKTFTKVSKPNLYIVLTDGGVRDTAEATQMAVSKLAPLRKRLVWVFTQNVPGIYRPVLSLYDPQWQAHSVVAPRGA